MEIISKLAIVSFDARAITGVVSADDGDGEVFTSRGARYLPPAALKRFAALRQATGVELMRIGTRFLDGYAIPEEKADEAAALLEFKKREWEQARAELLGSYYEQMSQWLDEHPELRQFQGLFPTLDQVEKRIQFEWTMFYLTPVESGKKGLEQMVGRLPAQIIREVVQDVRTSWSPGGQRVTSRTRGILKRAADKLESLAFVGGRLGEMARKLREVLAAMPGDGKLEPAEAALATMVLAMMSSETSIVELLSLDPSSVEAPSAPQVPQGASAVAISFEEETACEGVPATAQAAQALEPQRAVADIDEDDFVLNF